MATQVAIAQREEQAINRLQAAAQQLVAAHGELDAFQIPSHKDPALRPVVRLEAIANLVESVAALPLPNAEEINGLADEIKETTEALLLGRIEAIDGIGPKTMDLIRKGLAESSVEVEVELTAADESE